MAKVSIITGLYGSGKSEFTIQYAIDIASKQKTKVYIADLDVVNVYFRSREQAELLKEYGIEILGNVLGDDVNTDVPHLSANFYKVLSEENSHLIVDLAGNEAGLKMLGAFIEDFVKKVGSYEFLLVYNMYRGMSDVTKINEWIDYVNMISDLKVTSIINNSHLMEYTKMEDIKASQDLIVDATDIDIKYTMISKSVYDQSFDIINPFIMQEIYLRKHWD